MKNRKDYSADPVVQTRRCAKHNSLSFSGLTRESRIKHWIVRFPQGLALFSRNRVRSRTMTNEKDKVLGFRTASIQVW